jgi:hypothetical protein
MGGSPAGFAAPFYDRLWHENSQRFSIRWQAINLIAESHDKFLTNQSIFIDLKVSEL